MGWPLHDMPYSLPCPPPSPWSPLCWTTSELGGWRDSRRIFALLCMKASLIPPTLCQGPAFEIWFSSLICLFCNVLQTSVLQCGWVTSCLYSNNSYIALGATGRQTFLIFAKLCGFWETFTSLYLCHLLMLRPVLEWLHGGSPGIWKGIHNAL